MVMHLMTSMNVRLENEELKAENFRRSIVISSTGDWGDVTQLQNQLKLLNQMCGE